MIDNLHFALDGAWRVLLTGVILGAGLPLVFAAGVRSLAWGAGGDAEVSHADPNPLGRVLALVCFAAVVVAIALGITIVVATGMGKVVSFHHVFPTITDKPK